jgi:hypothetical protein
VFDLDNDGIELDKPIRIEVAVTVRDGERVVSRGAERLRDGQDWPP